MKTIEIPLQKKKRKFTLYAIAGAFISLMLLITAISIATKGFETSSSVLGGLLLFGFAGVGIALYQYYTYKNPALVVASDGVIINFRIKHDKGTGDKSEIVKLAKMKRFYEVNKRTRYFITERSFKFEPKKGISKTEIDVLPSLLDIDKAGVAAIMEFIAEVAPDIQLGYYGPSLSKLFK